MDRYIIIRSDNKSISYPMSRKNAINKIKEYNKNGISSYIVCQNNYISLSTRNNLNKLIKSDSTKVFKQ